MLFACLIIDLLYDSQLLADREEGGNTQVDQAYNILVGHAKQGTLPFLLPVAGRQLIGQTNRVSATANSRVAGFGDLVRSATNEKG